MVTEMVVINGNGSGKTQQVNLGYAYYPPRP